MKTDRQVFLSDKLHAEKGKHTDRFVHLADRLHADKGKLTNNRFRSLKKEMFFFFYSSFMRTNCFSMTSVISNVRTSHGKGWMFADGGGGWGTFEVYVVDI